MTAVLAVAAEVYPLVKTGGLADVVGALPAALKPHGVTMRVLVPGYPAVMAALEGGAAIHGYADLFGGTARLVAGHAAGLDLVVLDAPHLFDRPGNPYLAPDGADWPDNWRRFAALGRAGADIGRGLVDGFAVDVVHSHDWHAGLAPALLHHAGRAAATVMTVHNLAFQGVFPARIFAALGLPDAAFAIDGVEYHGDVGFMKAGLQYADAITTVSPSYAVEICSPEGGMGLDGLLRHRRAVLSGILNGIDTDVWNPARDAALPEAYDVDSLSRRAANRAAVAEAFALDPAGGMIFAVVSRLTGQKGMDLLGQCIEGLIDAGARLAVLGNGEPGLEAVFRAAAARHKGRVGVVIGYNERLAHLLQGGADAILVPSRFEPCGLTQLCGLRYGCVPVVARVGGLADSLVDANQAGLAAGVATGVQFMPVDRTGLEAAIARAIALHARPAVWTGIQTRGMKTDVSWTASAGRYAELYRDVLKRKRA